VADSKSCIASSKGETDELLLAFVVAINCAAKLEPFLGLLGPDLEFGAVDVIEFFAECNSN
jgi:hypothetical protein